MASTHNPENPEGGFFAHPRSRTLPQLPPGYDWKTQIDKYSSLNLQHYSRTGPSRGGEINKSQSNLDRHGSVFSRRGLHDQYPPKPESSQPTIDKGLLTRLQLHELGVRLYTSQGGSQDSPDAFLVHDAAGGRTATEAERGSQSGCADDTETLYGISGVDFKANDCAGTSQQTFVTMPGLARFIRDHGYSRSSDGTCQRPTFLLDVGEGHMFARMLAWFRNQYLYKSGLIVKGYNTDVASGRALLDAVDAFPSTRCGDDDMLEFIQGCHREDVTSVASASGHGGYIASGSHDTTICIWDKDSGSLVRTLEGHEGPVTSIALSAGNKELASGSQDTTVRIWDPATGEVLRILKGHTQPVTSVTFIPDTRQVASGSLDKTVRIWDLHTGNTVKINRDYTKPVAFIAPSSDGKKVASGAHGSAIRIWDLQTGEMQTVTVVLEGSVTAIQWTSTELVSGSDNGNIYVWNPELSHLQTVFKGHHGPVTSIAVHGWQITSASEDATCRVWDIMDNRLLYTLGGYTGPVTSVAASYASKRFQIVTGSRDKKMRVWAHRDFLSDLRTKSVPSVRAALVFLPHLIRDLALGKKGLTFDGTSAEKRLEALDYGHLFDTAMEHVMSFLDLDIPGCAPLVPDIVHSGLGLGYDLDDSHGRTALNPENGYAIRDLDLILDSRLDRALIEVHLQLVQCNPDMVFSSSTKLSNIYAEDSLHLAPGQAGETGIQARLRRIPGGLYPQSDIVTADDPFAEIAARTWIDEYARLDRSQLMTKTYRSWLADAPSDVRKAVNLLNGWFMPSTP